MNIARRDFLRFLAASPVVAGLGPLGSLGTLAAETGPGSAREALDVFELEAVARSKVPPAHWAFLETGVDGDATVRANVESYSNLALRMRRLAGSHPPDTSVTLFGTRWETPIFLSPVASQRAFHDDGEVATARAARAKGHLQILSNLSSASVEEVNRAYGGPVWFQLYPTDDWSVAQALMKRAEAAGSPALVLTIDLVYGSNRETQAKGRRQDSRECLSCHIADPFDYVGNLASHGTYRGLGLSRVKALFPTDVDWEYVSRVRAAWPRKLVVKGIVTREDAELCLRHGADAIVVSNHGGRAEESLRATIDCLPEVVEAVKGRVPVLIDGGVRRGTDVFKALALGATAVGIGRPQVWGLAAFGQPGVEAALEMLRRELVLVMRQVGVSSLAKIGPGVLVDRRRPPV